MSDSERNSLDALPHRPPFRFVSRLVDLRVGVSGEAIWTLDGREAFFAGHFPGRPIVPGVLISEALAQVSGLVAGGAQASKDSAPEKDHAASAVAGRLAHIDIRFHESVSPPVEISLISKQTRVFGSLYQFDVQARVGETTIARGRLAVSLPVGDTGASG